MRGPVTTLVTNVPIHNVLITLSQKRERERKGGSARNWEIRGKMVMMMIVLKTLSLMTLSHAP